MFPFPQPYWYSLGSFLGSQSSKLLLSWDRQGGNDGLLLHSSREMITAMPTASAISAALSRENPSKYKTWGRVGAKGKQPMRLARELGIPCVTRD